MTCPKTSQPVASVTSAKFIPNMRLKRAIHKRMVRCFCQANERPATERKDGHSPEPVPRRGAAKTYLLRASFSCGSTLCFLPPPTTNTHYTRSMDRLSEYGATTVVDGPSSSTHGRDSTFVDDLKKPAKSTSRPPIRDKFIDAVDYIDQQRPFFHRIGKGGMMEALQKLDAELSQVSSRGLGDGIHSDVTASRLVSLIFSPRRRPSHGWAARFLLDKLAS